MLGSGTAQAVRYRDGVLWCVTGRLAPFRYKVDGTGLRQVAGNVTVAHRRAGRIASRQQHASLDDFRYLQ